MKKVTLLFFCLLTVFGISAQKAGFVGLAASASLLADDDEKAAATWFVNTYGGDYIPVSEIGTKDLSQYSVLWIMNDRTDGKADAYDQFYAVAPTLNAYYKAGGNLLLSVHATNLLTEFGRVAEYPDLTGAGLGGDNPDVWQICPSFGTWEVGHNVHDNANDPIYAGLTTQDVVRGNGTTYKVFPVIGNSWKEDHNCFWSLNSSTDPKEPSQEARLTNWETNYNCDVLGTWGHVQDYFGAGVVRWKATDTYKGKCITLGIGGCEWNINNGGTNPYAANIERLFKNSLDELKVVKTTTPLKIGFVGLASTAALLADDDEKAAATWFLNTMGGDYIPVSEIGTKDLSQYAGLWIMNDRTDGKADAYDQFYAVAPTLNTYYKAGGNLLLSVHATNLLTEFGRVTEYPDLTGAGLGGENPDVWQICPSFGTWEAGHTVHDNATDPLYAGLTTQDVVRGNGNTYKVFPVIGNSWKEDHNCFWSLNSSTDPKEPSQEARLTNWETNYNCNVLGTWGHVQDYFGAGVVRWNATNIYKGKCITIGIGGCEWNINNGGTNPYAANIERLFKNALNEISQVSTGINNAAKSTTLCKFVVVGDQLRIMGVENAKSIEIINMNGSVLKKGNLSDNSINISNLSSGVFVVRLLDNSGNTLAIQKFLK